MKTHEDESTVSLPSAVISTVITLVGGAGLSILLGGLVQGFFALTAIGLVIARIVAWRRPFSLELRRRGVVPELWMVMRPRSGEEQVREPIAD